MDENKSAHSQPLRAVADVLCPWRAYQHYWISEWWTSQKWDLSIRQHITCDESQKYILEQNQNAITDENGARLLNILQNYVPCRKWLNWLDRGCWMDVGKLFDVCYFSEMLLVILQNFVFIPITCSYIHVHSSTKQCAKDWKDLTFVKSSFCEVQILTSALVLMGP